VGWDPDNRTKHLFGTYQKNILVSGIMAVRLGFLWESVRLALQSIFGHKLRTFLTLLGIIIGVAAVMVVGAGVEGLETYVTEGISRMLGSNSFIVSKYASFGHVTREDWERMSRRNKEIRMADVSFIEDYCRDCDEIVAEIDRRSDLQRGSKEILRTRVEGVTANRIFLGSQSVEEGRYFNDEEVRRSRYVCVIGEEVKNQLFPNVDALGKTLKMRSEHFRVIGVLEKQGSTFGQSLDNIMHIPITTFQRIYGTRSSITIRGIAKSRESFDRAVEQVRVAMRIRHKLKPSDEDTFGLISTEEINSAVDEFTSAIAVVVVPITLIALLVGGIVVMNIMLVSVTERTFEIGLRKSLGARRRDILNQFLIEAFFLAASGGLVGLLLAVIISWIIESTTPVTMTISLGYIFLSIGVSGGIGIVSGIYPAFRASRLDPIEALRTER
jgi:putative ABC transport system permease protein